MEKTDIEEKLTTIAAEQELPILANLKEIESALAEHNRALLIAAAGAGKSTIVPLHLLTLPSINGKIIMLEPRRVAARAIARRMATLLGENVGQMVGYQTRYEHVFTQNTRVLVVTERILTKMLISDPQLSTISAVIFDEFHERNLDADFALALAVESQNVLRPDLKLVVMSATLDDNKLSRLLGHPPIIRAPGRTYPVEIRYNQNATSQGLEQAVLQQISNAINSDLSGNILVFLPGQREIRNVVFALERLSLPDLIVVPLYGALDPAAQDLALTPAGSGWRKVVLATSIAETSLTIDNVRIVIDSGLTRVPIRDKTTGLSYLATRKASRASVDQRAGRAGRTAKGLAIRLWNENQNNALEPFNKPEIISGDLADLVLDCAAFGIKDPLQLTFMDPPPQASLKEARSLLVRLGALDNDGSITSIGRAMRKLPFDARLAFMVVEAQQRRHGLKATLLAIMLSERGFGDADCDLDTRLEQFRNDRGSKNRNIVALARKLNSGSPQNDDQISCGALLLTAFPERIAKLVGKDGTFLLAGGQRAKIGCSSFLARAQFIVAFEVIGHAERSQITAAAVVDEAELRERCHEAIKSEKMVFYNNEKGCVQAVCEETFGAIRLRQQLRTPSADEANSALVRAIEDYGITLLDWGLDSIHFRARVNFLHQIIGEPWPALSDDYLSKTCSQWLLPYLAGETSPMKISQKTLHTALEQFVGFDLCQELDKLAPKTFRVPAGFQIPITYIDADAVLRVQVQKLYGMSTHPTIGANKIPLNLELLSPAGRPIQITRDLPSFWVGSWREVRKDMRGRYPKHEWPEDPTITLATNRKR